MLLMVDWSTPRTVRKKPRVWIFMRGRIEFLPSHETNVMGDSLFSRANRSTKLPQTPPPHFSFTCSCRLVLNWTTRGFASVRIFIKSDFSVIITTRRVKYLTTISTPSCDILYSILDRSRSLISARVNIETPILMNLNRSALFIVKSFICFDTI